MTSVAFIGGVFPLVVATGAGAEMRQSLGMAVFSGMIGVSLFGIFLTPVFFFVLMRYGSRDSAKTALVSETAAPPGNGADLSAAVQDPKVPTSHRV
jgi:multidrug efflux pump